MEIKTKFGDKIEINEDKDIFYFPEGLVGFEEYKKFTIIEPEENSIFKYLQSIKETDLAFTITNPLLFWSNYEVDVSKKDLKTIGLKEAKNFAILVIVTINDNNFENITANLMGPIIVNMENKKAKQVVLDNENYSTKHSIVETLRGEKNANS